MSGPAAVEPRRCSRRNTYEYHDNDCIPFPYGPALMKEASDMAGCLRSLPAEMQRPGVKAAGGRKLRVSRTQQCCMNLCCPCVQSRNQFPGILLFDLGASLLCHKTGNHLTGWMTGSCWAPLGLGAHCSSPAHTPCHPPPPPSPHHFSHGRGYTMRSSPEGGTSPNFSPGQAVQN